MRNHINAVAAVAALMGGDSSVQRDGTLRKGQTPKQVAPDDIQSQRIETARLRRIAKGVNRLYVAGRMQEALVLLEKHCPEGIANG